MVVFSNHRLGPASEIRVSDDTARTVLRDTARAAAPVASARWEHELVRWLEAGAEQPPESNNIDVGDIAWTPDHFEPQRRFLIEAINAARVVSEESMILQRWATMIEAHPRDSVRTSQLWRRVPAWQPPPR